MNPKKNLFQDYGQVTPDAPQDTETVSQLSKHTEVSKRTAKISVNSESTNKKDEIDEMKALNKMERAV